VDRKKMHCPRAKKIIKIMKNKKTKSRGARPCASTTGVQSASAGLQVVSVDRNRFAIEVQGEKVYANLTQMAKPFGKLPKDWLKTEETKRYLDALSKRRKILLTDLVKVKNGGSPNEHGTWAYDHNVAVEFARWLDPAFAISVNELFWDLFTGKARVIPANVNLRIRRIDGLPCLPYGEFLASEGLSAISSSYWKRIRNNPQEFRAVNSEWYISEWYANVVHKSAVMLRKYGELTARRERYLTEGAPW
jgi:hypothetical protein